MKVIQMFAACALLLSKKIQLRKQTGAEWLPSAVCGRWPWLHEDCA